MGADGLRWARGGKLRTEDTEGTAADRGGASLRGSRNGCRQSGMARSRARARPNFSCHGQLCGQIRVRRRARAVRPGRRTKTDPRAGQVMRHHLHRRRRWRRVNPTPYFRVSNGFSTSRAAVVGPLHLPVDGGCQLGTGRGLDPPEPHRCGIGSVRKSGLRAAPSKYGIGLQSASGNQVPQAFVLADMEKRTAWV